MELIKTGKIVNVHGIRGEIKVLPWSDYPEDLLELETLTIDGNEYPVERARVQGTNLLFKLKGIDTVEEAEKLRNKVVWAEKIDFELEDGEYFWEDLLGMKVFDADNGTEYGTITDILRTGANDVYEITSDNEKKLYIPAIGDCIKSVSVEEKQMRIHPLPGLFDL